MAFDARGTISSPNLQVQLIDIRTNTTHTLAPIGVQQISSEWSVQRFVVPASARKTPVKLHFQFEASQFSSRLDIDNVRLTASTAAAGVIFNDEQRKRLSQGLASTVNRTADFNKSATAGGTDASNVRLPMLQSPLTTAPPNNSTNPTTATSAAADTDPPSIADRLQIQQILQDYFLKPLQTLLESDSEISAADIEQTLRQLGVNSGGVTLQSVANSVSSLNNGGFDPIRNQAGRFSLDNRAIGPRRCSARFGCQGNIAASG